MSGQKTGLSGNEFANFAYLESNRNISFQFDYNIFFNVKTK